MCLIPIAHKVHADYPLILAANRDEYYQRPSRSVHCWEDHSSVLAGRDLTHGGTWLGIEHSSRIAAVANYRQTVRKAAGTKSRGFLVSDYLIGGDELISYMSNLSASAEQFDGFNLIVGNQDNLYFLSSNQHPSKK